MNSRQLMTGLLGLAACSGDSRARNAGDPARGDAEAAAGAAGQDPGAEPSYTDFACTFGECDPLSPRVMPLPKVSCPAVEPMKGANCEGSDSCTYGDSVTSHCRRAYRCEAGRWIVPTDLQGTCVEQPESFCPPAPPHGATCTVGEVDARVPCGYEHGVACYCLGNPDGRVGAPGTWECYGPPRNGACPELLPNIGDGCAKTAQFCSYGVVMQGCYAPYAEVYCYQGAWEVSGDACAL